MMNFTPNNSILLVKYKKRILEKKRKEKGEKILQSIE